MNPDEHPPVAEATGVASERPAAPDPAMILEGGVVPGDVTLLVRCMVEELLQMGMAFEQVVAMSHDAGYQALFAARQTMGDQDFDRVIEDCHRRVGRVVHRTSEPETQSGATELTLNTQPKSSREMRDA